MKTNIKMFLMAIFLIAGTSIYAQQGNGKGRHGDIQNLPDVTEEQKALFEEMKTDHITTMKALKKELDEKTTELKSLMSNPDGNEEVIDQLIHEISGLTDAILVERVRFHLALRAELTDDQIAVFDSKPFQVLPGKGRGKPGQQGKPDGHGPK